MHSKKLRILLIAIVSIFVSGCVFYPKQTEYYDHECGVIAKKLTLEVEVDNGGALNCGEPACILVLLGIGVVSAAVSSTVVVVGNTIHSIDKRSNCAEEF